VEQNRLNASSDERATESREVHFLMSDLPFGLQLQGRSMPNITELSNSVIGEKAQELLESIGLKTLGVRPGPDHTAEVPQINVDLSTEFPKSYALLEAYTKAVGGEVTQYSWVGGAYRSGFARFSFKENRSLLLIRVADRDVCSVRGYDKPF
jgi:hypothetical protein